MKVGMYILINATATSVAVLGYCDLNQKKYDAAPDEHKKEVHAKCAQRSGFAA